MKTQRLFSVLMLGVLFSMGAAAPQTWQLDPQSGWIPAASLPGTADDPAMAEVRRAMASGQSRSVVAALEGFKRDYPDMAGGDLDAFLDAERVYAKRNLGKAGKLYKDFLEKWPGSIYEPAAMDRYFSIGAAFLQGQKRVFLGILRLPAFDDGVTIMRHIADRAGNTPIALRALQVTAENQERRKKYIEAYHTWAEISVRWPTGAEGRDALLRMARALHTSYGGPDYDATALDSARSYFEDFMLRYPDMAQELRLSETLTLLSEQRAYKEYDVGFYYERADNRTAAERFYQKVQDGWPNSSAAQMAAARLEPAAPPAVKPTIQRKLFNATGTFLDSWFGARLIFKPDTPQDALETR